MSDTVPSTDQISAEQKERVLAAVHTASHKWATAFNSGDAEGCAAAYELAAVINAKPFGTIAGRADIEGFWSKLITDGFSNVEYIEPHIDVIDAQSAILSSKWRMNKAHGVITKELWVIQDDGTALLREDDFEVLG